MRKLTIKDFDSAHEFEQYKRDMRKADKNKRTSVNGRRDYSFEE